MNVPARSAMSRMIGARSALILSQPFFGTLALHLKMIEDPACDTMATDAKAIFFNPGFVATLTDRETQGVIAHEVMHCALKHCTRRGARDSEVWNEACDHAINHDLARAGFTLPKGALMDPQFDGLNADQIFRLLTTKPEPEPAAEPESEPNEGEAPDGDESSDESGTDGQDSGETGQEPGKEGQGTPSEGDGAEGDREPGAATGGNPGAVADQTDKAPDYSKPGEVRDASPDAGERGEIESDWEVLTRQAINVSKAHEAGALPGYLARLAAELATSKTDWRDVLRRFLTPSDNARLSWSRPSRRFVSSGLFLPGRVNDGVHHVAWIVDTSGSMNDQALSASRAELQAALDEGIVDRFTILYVDTAVSSHASFSRGDEIEFKPTGGGGTRFAPAFAWLDENEPDISAAIYFTDMDCSDFGYAPAYPVLWAGYGQPGRLAELFKRAPFGECLAIEY